MGLSTMLGLEGSAPLIPTKRMGVSEYYSYFNETLST